MTKKQPFSNDDVPAPRDPYGITKMEAEFGDVMFSMVNYARFLNINPENALERTNKKFIGRFQYLEAKAKERGKSLKDMTLEEMDVFWEEAKTFNQTS